MKLRHLLRICLLTAGLAGLLVLVPSCGIIKPDGVVEDILTGRAKPLSRPNEDAKRYLDSGLCSKLCDDPTGVSFKVDLSHGQQ